jgi:hypothetical protein
MHGGDGSITGIDSCTRFPNRVAAQTNAEQPGSISRRRRSVQRVQNRVRRRSDNDVSLGSLRSRSASEPRRCADRERQVVAAMLARHAAMFDVDVGAELGVAEPRFSSRFASTSASASTAISPVSRGGANGVFSGDSA